MRLVYTLVPVRLPLDLGGRGEDVAYFMMVFECLHRAPLELVETSNSLMPLLLGKAYKKRNLACTTKQGSRATCLALTGFAAFGKGAKIISDSIML